MNWVRARAVLEDDSHGSGTQAQVIFWALSFGAKSESSARLTYVALKAGIMLTADMSFMACGLLVRMSVSRQSAKITPHAGEAFGQLLSALRAKFGWIIVAKGSEDCNVLFFEA